MKYVKPEIKITNFDTEEILAQSSNIDTQAVGTFEAAGITVNNAAAINVSELLNK